MDEVCLGGAAQAGGTRGGEWTGRTSVSWRSRTETPEHPSEKGTVLRPPSPALWGEESST